MDRNRIRKILSVVCAVLLIAIVIYNYMHPSDQANSNESNSLSADTAIYITPTFAPEGSFFTLTPDPSPSEAASFPDVLSATDGGYDDYYTDYYFRNDRLLTEHYEKHGIEMGFSSKEAYEQAAGDVINNPAALYKLEKEDGDEVYYLEATNEFVILSKDGYIRTYFLPDSRKKYFDKQ